MIKYPNDRLSIYGALSKLQCMMCSHFRVLSSKYGLDKIAEKLKEYEICGLVIVGGFEVGRAHWKPHLSWSLYTLDTSLPYLS